MPEFLYKVSLVGGSNEMAQSAWARCVSLSGTQPCSRPLASSATHTFYRPSSDGTCMVLYRAADDCLENLETRDTHSLTHSLTRPHITTHHPHINPHPPPPPLLPPLPHQSHTHTHEQTHIYTLQGAHPLTVHALSC